MDRTANYLQAVKKNMGYIGTNHSWRGIVEILREKLPGVIPKVIANYPQDTTVYKYDTKYCAELNYRTDIDDYNIETHIFSKFPSEQDVKTARAIDQLEISFKLKQLSPIFTCWECGLEKHWLDIPGSLFEKITNLKKGYCGC